MRDNKNSINTALFALVAFGISGCTTGGPQSVTGERVVDSEEFKKGSIRLDCQVSCAFAAGMSKDENKDLYKNKRWGDLVGKVVSVGFGDNLSYFYLAQAAEGLGYDSAAEQYYNLSLLSHNCNEAFDNCGGISVQDEARSGLRRLSGEHKNSAVSQQSSDVGVSKETSAGSSSVSSNKSVADGEEKAASGEAEVIRESVLINASGYPEVLLSGLGAQQARSDLKGNLIKEGWFVSEDSDSGLTAVRSMDPARAAGLKFAAAVSSGQKGFVYSDGIYFYFESESSGTRLMARPYIVKQSPNGQEVLVDQKDRRVLSSIVHYLDQFSSSY